MIPLRLQTGSDDLQQTMAMKHLLNAGLLMGSVLLFSACPDDRSVASPDGELRVEFRLGDGGRPSYTIVRQGGVVIEDSRLGVVIDGLDLSEDMVLVQRRDSRPVRIQETYSMIHGKERETTYVANERTFSLRHPSGRLLDVVFRVSDDGVAFRYHLAGESGAPSDMDAEATTFVLPPGTRAWLTPLADVNTGWAATQPSYEEHYFKDVEVGHPQRTQNGWAYPALFRVDETWVLISEAGVGRRYAGTRLRNLEAGNGYRVAFPQDDEVVTGGIRGPRSTLPWTTPWRIVVVGDLATIVETTLAVDLAEPNALGDVPFVTPGRASWSWAKLKDESVVSDVQREFIDYAADMGWEYTLVDVNWDRNIGYDGIAELAEYAAGRGVGLLLWYNSSGDWNETVYTPKSRLLTREERRAEFARISAMGIRGVKVDFFPGDGQSAINYYFDIFEDAADYGLMVNTHGCTLPRAWHRTYPNLVTMESVMGFEFITFEQRNANEAPSHGTMQPFTRNVFSPMDYTPVSLDEIPNIRQRTTNGYELATAVVFYSGVQHFAETPRGMAQAPDFAVDFLRQVPATWDETRFIQGFPGELAVLARRSGDTWYVGGMNGEPVARTLEIELSRLGGVTRGFLISDGQGPRDLVRTEITVNGSDPLPVGVSPNGGFVMVLR
jgi:alpha-glucosidase